MTTPLEPLLGATDFASFKAKDEAWFLNAVGETLRDFCGWHIAPILTVTGTLATVGNKGIIMLPTTQLQSVEAIRWDAGLPYALDNSLFRVHTEGWVELLVCPGRSGRGRTVEVDFTHGYETLPTAVAQVGFELTADALEKSNGVVTDMTRGPTRLKFKELGVVLSQDQKDRLGPYTLVGP